MDCISPILDIATRLWDCTDKRAVYVRELPENLISLRNAMEKLQNVYEDVKDKVEREEKLQKKLSVEAIEKEVKEHWRKVMKKSRGNVWEPVVPKTAVPATRLGRSPPVILRPSEKTVGLDLLLGEVWSVLQDDKVESMRIYGMGCVGKTTHLKRINNEFLQTGYEVDVVIWVVVSQQGNVEKVQETILNKLEIAEYKWKDRSVHERAEEIISVLQTKKFVLLLDDIWKQLDLLEVGIPPLNDQNKSKVIFTTRFSTVCHDMGAKNIEVECLACEEAFSLFRTKVGEDTLNSHPDIRKLAEIFVKECKGLPLALITVGRAMAEMKTPEEWEKKIQILKRYPSEFPACENGKKKNKFVVKEQVELIKGHEITKWKNAQRISVWNSGIEERMAPPPFPNLETLLSVGGLMKPFLSGFFRYMPVIRVLALVENYELTELPVEIGELVTLQYLNLSLTGIKELPMELKKLTKLSFYNSGATIGDCSALLEELESLEHLNEIFITLRSVTPKLEINICDDLEDVKFIVEKERGGGFAAYNVVQSNMAKHQNFCYLRHVAICHCPKLLNLTWFIYATRLQFLNVSFCDSMEEVVEDKKNGVSEIQQELGLFSRLVSLHLSCLPNLRRIYRRPLQFPSLKEMTVKYCPNLGKLPFDSKAGISNSLQKIHGAQEWWDGLEWEDQTIMQNLIPYFVPILVFAITIEV
ncbi:putative disease resistance protein [Vitis vinifera]|uniref:Putative disease resistance protein n=1 Tax=Vitis vinifera TaxID=29760 RepID=A0A438CPI4_VITVI|nr:putative disease resistance protein [Vitis vinifera]